MGDGRTIIVPMLYAVLVRTLREDATYEDFRRSWMPEQGYGVPVRVVTARRVDDPREVITIGEIDLPVERLPDALDAIAVQEQQRHDQIEDVIESTQIRGIYEGIAEDTLF